MSRFSFGWRKSGLGAIKAPWRGGSPTARPALRRRGLVQARRPVFEALETRQMLSHYAAPIVFDSPTPVPIPVADAKAGQTVPMTIDFTTTDTTTPETSENEYLEIRGSAGYSTTILNYGTQTIHVPITANGETFSAWIDGADGDEQASILVGDRHLTYTTDLAALSTTWDDLAYGVKQTMNAIKAVTSYTPGWSVVADGNVIPNIGGTVSVGLDLAPDGSIDSATYTLNGTITDEGTLGLFWGVQALNLGFSFGFTGKLEAGPKITATYDGEQWHFGGSMDVTGSVEGFGQLNATVFTGRGAATGSLTSSPELDAEGVLSGDLNFQASVSASLKMQLPGAKNATTLGQVSYAWPPETVTHYSIDLMPMVDYLENMAIGGDDPEFDTAGALAGPAAAPRGTVHTPDATQAAGTDGAAKATSRVNPAAAATQLVVTSQPPSTVTAGAPFSVAVSAEDSSGSVDTSFNGNVTLWDWYGDLVGTTTVAAVNGVATFSGLTVDTAGDQYLEAYSNNFYCYSNGFTVNAAAATQLVVNTPYSAVVAASPFSVTADAEDPYGNIDPTFGGDVTLALASGPTGATLGGALTVAASNGVASFPDVTLAPTGSYTLSATSSGLTSGTSSSFDVTDQLVVTTQPPAELTAGTTFGLVVAAEDGTGQVDTSFNGNVTLYNWYGGLGGNTTVAAVNGVATFSGLTVDTAGDQYLEAYSNNFYCYSNDFTVNAAAATQLVVNAPYGAVVAASPFSVTVDAEDPYGNIDPTFSGDVTLALASGPAGATVGGALTVAASNGVASFPDVTLAPTGSYTLSAISSGLTTGTSSSFDVTDQLVVTAQPAAEFTAGTPFGLVVSAEDGTGQVDTSFNGNVTLYNWYGGLGGNTTVAAVNGVATFSGLTVDTAADQYLEVDSNGLPSVDTDYFQVDPGAAATFSFSQIGTMPWTWAVGNPFVNPNSPFDVQVTAQDRYGNYVSGFDGNVTLSLANNPYGAALGGTLAATASNGYADFPSVTVNQLGQNYTLAATSGSVAGTSAPFDVLDQLVLTTPAPSTVVAGAPFGLVVAAENSAGAVDTSFNGPVTVNFCDFAGGPTSGLQGVITVNAVQGVATFSGLSIDQAGSDGLELGGNGLAFTQQLIAVTPGSATQLVVTTEPQNATTGAPLTLAISAEDPFGNVDPSYSGNVTVALLNNAGGGVLSGTLTEPSNSGVATFSNLSLNVPGAGYAMQATASELGSASTTAFNVTVPGVATQLVVTSQPPYSLAAGTPFGLTVEAEDSEGTLDANFDGNVTLSLIDNPFGATLEGTVTATAVNGVATFAGLAIDTAGYGYAIQAGSNGLSAGNSQSIYVSAAAATQLVVLGPYDNVLTGSPFGMTVQAEDPYGNVDPNFSGNMTLALANNPGSATLGGTLTETAYDGVAEFSDLTIDQPGSGYTLQAAGGTLPAGTSQAFDVDNDQLAVTLEPPSAVAMGTTFGLTVAAEDGSGAVDPSFNGQVTIGLSNFTGNDATLSGTLTATAVDGVATFSGLTLDQVGLYALSVTAADMGSAATLPFNVTATQLVVAAQPPVEVTAGAPFSVTVVAGDAAGNVDSTFDGLVTLALASNQGGATLGGTLTVTAIDGVATFSDLTLSSPGSVCTFQATTAGLAPVTSDAVTIVATGTPTQLVVTSEPTNSVAAGASFGVTVKAEDSLGDVISSFQGSVTIADPAGPLSGTLTVNATGGVATFSGLSIDQAGFYWLTASAAGLTQATTNTVTVNPAAATQLVIPALNTALLTNTLLGVQLPTVLAGAPFGLEVLAEDRYGNVDWNFSGNVTLSLQTNPGGATLSGTVTVAATDGVANFSALSLNDAGNGYTLAAASPGLSAGISPTFAVSGDQLVVTTQPPASIVAGAPFGLVVTAENSAGIADPSFNGSISVSDPFFGQTLGGTTTVTASGGVATFSGLSLTEAGQGNWLIVSSGSLPITFSDAIDVLPGNAAQLAVVTQPPANTSVAAPFEVDVAVEDDLGNFETGFNGNVTMGLASGPTGGALGGTLTAAATNGVAAFPGLTLSQAGSYVLQATSAGLTSVNAGAVNVTPAGMATQLVITAQPPSSVAAGSSFDFIVTVEDGFGAVVKNYQGSVTVSDPLGGGLGGTLTLTPTGGVAAFSLTDDVAGVGNTLVATSSGVNSATSNPFTVTPLVATKLDVWGPSGTVSPASAFTVSVFAEDLYGNVDPNFDGSVTLALETNPAGGALSGTLKATAVGGEADFSGLTINVPGNGYTLQAQSSGLTSATSTPFNVTTDRLVVTSQPPANATTSSKFGLTVIAENAQGNLDTNFAGSVTATMVQVGATGATLSGLVTVTAKGGTVTFSGLNINESGSYLLSLGGSNLGATMTNAITVTGPTIPVTMGFVLTSDHPSGSVAGQTVVFTAVYNTTSGTPTGNVTFKNGTKLLGTGTLNAQGQATLSISTLTVGASTITAVYPGSANVPAASASLSQTVCLDPTSIVLTASASAQSVTFTAKVSASAPGSAVPTGNVTFKAGKTTLGTAALNSSGIASVSAAASKVAGQTITATFAGNKWCNGGSASLAMTDSHVATSTVVSASISPSVSGQTVTFTAKVTSASGAFDSGGTVQFAVDGAAFGAPVTLSGGAATLSDSVLGVGSHTISAAYIGDTAFSASSGSVMQAVSKAPTYTVLTSTFDPAVFGQAVTFTATVSAAVTGIGVPTGVVTFKDGSKILGTGTLDADGTAVFSSSAPLTVGSHAITASYTSTSQFAASDSGLTETVNKAATTTSITASVNPAKLGQAVTFTITVSAAAPGSGTPTGKVVLMDGSVKLGTVSLDTTGKATFGTAKLTVGTQAITASYGGDAHFTASTISMTETVNKTDATTAISASAVSLLFGKSVASAATATPVSSNVDDGDTVQFPLDDAAFGPPVPLGTKADGTDTSSSGDLAQAVATATTDGVASPISALSLRMKPHILDAAILSLFGGLK